MWDSQDNGPSGEITMRMNLARVEPCHIGCGDGDLQIHWNTQLTPPSHWASRPLSLTAFPLWPLKCGRRVSLLRYSCLRFSTKAAECWPALLRPPGTALFIYDTDRRLVNSRCGFYGLETSLSETNLNCPHRSISHVLPSDRWQGCWSPPSLSQLVTYKIQGLLRVGFRTNIFP